ncbi:MAG TPA: hypothetical protein VL979_12550 [Solirubrobacteraceae bacterium]|nr:hypothetical protein [Solirubrobacteraceae bacterium]
MPHSIHARRPAARRCASARRARALTAAALVGGALVAGCGGGSPSPPGGASASASASGAVESGVAFARCIRSHGVPSFPDPKVSGQAVRMGSRRTIQSPAFQSALRSCRRLLPKGSPSSQPPSTQTRARMLAASACMRKHGIAGFPDPSASPPSSAAGNGAVLGGGGYYLAIPKSIDTSAPAFRRAAAACKFFRPGR